MPNQAYDVVAVGNAIVDVIGRCDDAFLTAHGAPKGHMRLVDAEQVAALYNAMGPAREISGGSAANTVAGVASFGGRPAYMGKVADDEFGRIFTHDLNAAGVTYRTRPKSGGDPTARSLVLVTPDGERTMSTFLGVSPQFDAADLDVELISSASILYLEGYLFDQPEAKAAFYRAADIARGAGVKVALTLSDAFCVERHRPSFRDLLRTRIDIVFANESELLALAQTSTHDEAIEMIAPDVELLAATQSAKGSILVSGQTRISVAPVPVPTVVDTTGAGDLYAAGVLFGLSKGLPLSQCGALGSIAAAEIICHLGARPERSLQDLARKAGLIT